jgi:hypothetical protein
MVLENKIDRFISKIEMGRDFFIDAAHMLVTMIDEEPGVCERIIELRRVDWLTKDVLDTFEAIGRKQLAVEAMFLPRHVLAKLIAFPVEEQARVATTPVRVCNGAKHRKIDPDLKHVAELTRKEAAVVFGPRGVRTVEEQQRVIEETEAAPAVHVGYFELTMMNGKPFLKRCEKVARAQRVKIERGQAVIEVVS